MQRESCKILASSVDPWSDNIGSDTLTSLLSIYDSSNIASINIRAKRSDSKVAGRYFHIIEGRVIKSVFSSSVKTGESYCVDDNSCETVESDVNNEIKLYTRKYRINRWLLVLAREFLWKLGKWQSKELDEFVDSFNPDVLFFPIESYIHFNRINTYIINKYKPNRVVGYMWDDNFSFKQHPYNPLYLLHRFWLRKSVKHLIHKCDVVFAISPMMKSELDREYGIDSVLLTKPVRSYSLPTYSKPQYPIKIIYTGKLGIGRDKTIAELVNAIKIVNAYETKIVLDLYTGSPIDPKLRRTIDSPGNCNINGFIPQSQVFELQQEADILLFVESMNNNDLSARLSFSTKITDYLSFGKCIWAIGNNGLAPIDYLREEDAALVSCSKETIVSQLQRIIRNPSLISEYALKSYRCGVRNHSKVQIHEKFMKAING